MNTGQVWWELLSEKFLEAFEKKKEEEEKMANSCSLEMDLRLLETQVVRTSTWFSVGVKDKTDVRSSLINMVGSIINIVEKIDRNTPE